MLRQRPTFRWIHRLMKEMDTDIARFRLGNVHIIPVTCPEIAREFLKKHGAIFSSRPTSMATRIYSGGFLTTILSPYSDQWKKIKRVIVSEIISPKRHHCLQGDIYNTKYFPCLVGLDFDGHERFVEEATRTVNNYHDPIIDSRIGKWRSDEPHDLLDVLVTLIDAEGKPLLTPEEIKAQVTEIMFATIDNPSNAVEWAMAEMINQPKILETAMDELDRVVDKERLVQECDIPHLNYIKACIREAFRLHPIAPFVPPHIKSTSDCTEVQLTEPDLRFISLSIGRRGCVAPLLGTTMTVMLLTRMVQGFYWKASLDVKSINLDESLEDMFLADPLVTQAKPRLPLHLYP
ncbi:hypothetical protein EUGRSUZ_I00272 [Eucalyptus grandis]|uniref:Uncharacterized protein n=2 Tax=Eucalyptus grandis TaxID=71139 RepID=A0ACC3JDC8_EUCGR|nr:hypothetical protein EUGRSUZ_I00272 [Eucalyptus grandis]